DLPFVPGEKVTVNLNPVYMKDSESFLNMTYQFAVYNEPENLNPETMQKIAPVQGPVFDYSQQKSMARDPVVLDGVSIPSNFPWIRILASNNPAEGYIFMNHGADSFLKYHMILNNTGTPVWYFYSHHWDPRNFRLHANGEIAMNVYHPNSFGDGYISMDNTYSITDSFWVDWNGYKLDNHELLILEDGSCFMIGYKYYTVDMSQLVDGGLTNVSVMETSIFGYSSGSKIPNFIWRALDNFDIADNDAPDINDLTAKSIRFPHMNAIDVDTDGNILLSCRHLSEITKINPETGEIIWRLGGNHNQFTFINDPLQGPSNQHDIRALGDNHYTVFDNGNQHTPQVSRGVEWEINTDAMTATLVWEHRNNEVSGKYSYYMGNNQRLPNGNRLINWATGRELSQLATEVTSDGTKALEFEFEDRTSVYRIHKFPWNAIAKVPYLVIEVYSDAVTLIFNKFGDSDVDYYNIYGGISPQPSTVIATSENPYIHLTNEVVNDSRNYFRVTAVSHSGQESGFSNQEEVLVRFVNPGENVVDNGDFNDGFDNWDWLVRDADADYEVTENEELHFVIQDGGSEDWNIQAVHSGISLIQGKAYLFEFDAYATQNRVVYFDVRKDGDPWTNHSKIGGTLLTLVQTHYAYEFIMEEPSEPEACIVLNVGANDDDVYVDNVSLKQVGSSTVIQKESNPYNFKLDHNYPNLFNPTTRIRYVVSREAFVHFAIVNLAGQQIQTLVKQNQMPGAYTVHWDGCDESGDQMSSGVYFYRLMADDFCETRKMLLIR
ncbi:aryl-sulfate sulfotransferase, partial [candidate division KSB1 bacterium]|nr:aryl-sulfate sulfotransferase [candidate division KSB1 bacterium]